MNIAWKPDFIPAILGSLLWGVPLLAAVIRLRAESARSRRAEEQLQVITDVLPAYVSYTDRDRRYRFVNRAYETWSGLGRDAILGRTLREFAGETTAGRAEPSTARALAGEPSHYSLSAPAEDGTVRHYEVTYEPHRDSSGQVVGFVSLGVDITERENARKHLQHNDERFRILIEQSPYALQIFSPEGEALYANPAWERLWQSRIADLSGYNIRRDVNAAAMGHAPLVERAFAGERVTLPAFLYDPSAIGKHGRKRWILSHFYPVHEESGSLREVVLLMEDITDSREATDALAEREAQLRDALQARDEFLSIASHELRTPLTALKFQAQIGRKAFASDTPVEARLARLIKTVDSLERQTTRMSRLVDDMLDISRIRSGDIRVSMEPLDLARLARELIEKDAFSEELTRLVAVDAPEPAPVLGDRIRLEQVLSNLLTNAVKYGDGRPITVQVERSKDSVCLRVRDQGIGIAPVDQERIFERFERALDSRSISGMGLGLYIVRQIVRSHGGRIRVESSKGDGSTFIVELPAHSSNASDT